MTAGHADSVVGVEKLRVLFGGVAAVDGVDLEVRQGEVFVLVGPNGSGKTTLLNAISGFVTLTAGAITLAGIDITRRRPHQRALLGLGRTFQNPRALPSTRVRDILSGGLYQHDPRSWWQSVFRPFRAVNVERRIEDQFGEALSRVGLPSNLLNEDLSSLAHGQLKMVDMARALLGEPQVLLLDEPTSGLNQDEIERLRDIVNGLREEGYSLVLVEHNVHFVLDLADRVAVMHRGRLLAIGEPRETLSREEVVEAYLGPKGRISKQNSEDLDELTPTAKRAMEGRQGWADS